LRKSQKTTSDHDVRLAIAKSATYRQYVIGHEKIKNLNLTEIEYINKLEKACFNSDYEFKKIFKKLVDEFDKSNDIKLYSIEMSSFNLWVQGTTNNRFPGIQKDYYNPERKETLKTAFSKRTNPILKARYAEILFEIDKKERDFGKLAAENLLKASHKYLDNKHELCYVDALNRSLALYLFLKDEEMAMNLVEQHEKGITIASDKNLPFALSGLIRSITSKKKQLKHLDINHELFRKSIRKNISKNHIPSQTTYSNERMLLQEMLQFPKAKTNIGYQKTIIKEIGKAFEKEGDLVANERSKQVAAHFYEQALNQFINAECDSTEINQIKTKIREANNYAVKNEFGRVPIKMSIPIEVVENALSIYSNKKMSEVIKILVADPNGMISYESTEKKIKEEIHPINPFSVTALRKGIKIAKVDTIEERIKHEVIETMVPSIEFSIRVFLDKIFDIFLSNKSLFVDELRKYIIDSDFIDDNRIKTIEHSVKLYLDKDYISSMHLIVFQIEAILKTILHSIEGEIFNYKSKKMTELTLGTIISKLLKYQIVNTDLLRYIEVNLTDQRGKNLRNDIAHGNRNFKEFNKYDNQLLIYLLMKLAALKSHDL